MDNSKSLFYSENYNERLVHQVPGKNQYWIPEKPLAGTQF